MIIFAKWIAGGSQFISVKVTMGLFSKAKLIKTKS